jgi:hypothetical protein
MYVYLAILEEEFQEYKRVIRISKSKKSRQHNGQNKKKTHDNPQNTTQKTEDRATRTPLRTGVELRCSGRVGSYVLTVDILIHFFIGCLQRGTCPTIVYSALLYISRCVTGDSIRLGFV